MNSAYDGYDMIDVMKRADDGDIDAMNCFVNLYFASQNKETFKALQEKCFEYVQKLAAAGDPVGYIRIADEFVTGKNLKKDIPRAIEYYQKAIDHGQKVAYEFMGLLYYEGKDIPADYKKAYELFMKSDFESNGTEYTLGEMYRLGLYVEQSDEKAREYYQKVIDAGEYMPGSDIDWYFYCASERLKGNNEPLIGDWEKEENPD